MKEVVLSSWAEHFVQIRKCFINKLRRFVSYNMQYWQLTRPAPLRDCLLVEQTPKGLNTIEIVVGYS
jgi:hypothetical protein